MVKTKGRKAKYERKQQVAPRKEDAKHPLRTGREQALVKWVDDPREQIVCRAADKSEERAEQKGVQMAHLNSPVSLPFPLP